MQSGSSAFTLARIPHTHIKPHPRSALAKLNDERRLQLHAWLKKLPYTKVVKLMMEQWGVKTHPISLSCYYHKHVAFEIIQERQRALGIATQLKKEIKARPCDYAEAILDGLGRRTTELSKESEVHPKVLQIWVDMFCKAQEQEIRKRALRVKERRIRLLEKQAAEARETAQDSKLSAEERAERIRRIFKPSLNEPDEAQPQNNGNSFTV